MGDMKIQGVSKVCFCTLSLAAGLALTIAASLLMHKGIKNVMAQGLTLKDAIKSPLILKPTACLVAGVAWATTMLTTELRGCIPWIGDATERAKDDKLLSFKKARSV